MQLCSLRSTPKLFWCGRKGDREEGEGEFGCEHGNTSVILPSMLSHHRTNGLHRPKTRDGERCHIERSITAPDDLNKRLPSCLSLDRQRK